MAGCVSACLYDADNRCGPHQVVVDDTCVCDEGYVLEGTACAPKPAPTPAPDGGSGDSEYTGQKAPCSSDADCEGFDANFCNTLNGYCIVTHCTEDSCDEGWTCTDLSVYLPGLPTACTFDADQP